MRKYAKDAFVVLFLTLVVGLLIWRNYVPGTVLTGIDNFHIEYNLDLAWQRSISAVWQEFQGVGLLGGLAHASDLPRVLLYRFFSVFMPIVMMRYAYIFLMLWLGPIGLYGLFRYVFKHRLAGLFAALFYLFNLATVQMFFMPTEMFVTQYGYLPWLFWWALKWLDEGKKRDLALFVFLTFVSMPQAMTPTLFLAYLFGLGVWVVGRQVPLQRKLILGGLIVLANLFWMLPFAYFTFTSSQTVIESKINSIFTKENFLQNVAHGNLGDIAILKGAWFDYPDYVQGEFVPLMRAWEKHLSQFGGKYLGFGFFGIIWVGVVNVLVRKRKGGVEALILGLLVVFMLLTVNPPFGFVFAFLQAHFPLFGEALRFPFTKFAFLAALAFSLLFGLGWQVIFSMLRRLNFILGYGWVSLMMIAFVWFGWPAISGYLVSDGVRVKVPATYTKLYDFMNTLPTGRVANFPQYKYWAWNYHDWGYRGSGFLWYGLKHPILDRAFDVWSGYSESYYLELQYALKQNDAQLLNDVFQKYRVDYILLDESMIDSGGDSRLYKAELKQMLAAMSAEQIWKQDFLAVWRLPSASRSFVWAPATYSVVNAEIASARKDVIYNLKSDYISNSSGEYYPFADLYKDKLEGWKLINNSLVIERTLFSSPKSVVLEATNSGAIINTADSIIRITLPLENSKISKVTFEEREHKTDNCDLFKRGGVDRIVGFDSISYVAVGGGAVCDVFNLSQVDYAKAYALYIKGENLSGRSLKIYLTNNASGQNDLEELLSAGLYEQIFLVLPYSNIVDLRDRPQGYSLNVETRSFGAEVAENRIDEIAWWSVPLDWVAGIKVNESAEVKNRVGIRDVKKYGTSYYSVKITGNGLLALSQGYDPGWMALSGLKKLPHVKVNGWANGWEIPEGKDNREVTIVYWPQYLEWLGLGLLGLLPILVIIKPKDEQI